MEEIGIDICDGKILSSGKTPELSGENCAGPYKLPEFEKTLLNSLA